RFELVAHRTIRFHSVWAARIDDVDQDRRALDVAQEPMPQTGAHVCAGDQPRYVGQHEHVQIVRRSDPQIGTQRRERVIADPRLGRAGRREQARFPSIRLADQGRRRDCLQLQIERALLARLAFLRNARSALRAGGKVRVAQAAAPTPRDHDHVAGVDQIRGQPIVRADLRTGRDVDDQILTSLAVLARASPVATFFGMEVTLAGEVEQRRYASTSDEVDAAAASTIAAVGPAKRHEFLPTERDDTVAAVPSFYPDLRLVYVNAHVFSQRPSRGSTRPAHVSPRLSAALTDYPQSLPQFPRTAYSQHCAADDYSVYPNHLMCKGKGG